MNRQQKRDSLIAGLITLIAVILLVLLLLFGSLTYDGRQFAAMSTPEISMITDEEETFIEPELLKDLGEEDAVNHDAPAPAFKGEPEPDVKDNTRQVVPGRNPKPAPPVEEKITQKKESPVKATTPTVTDEEKKKVTSSVARGFQGQNGVKEGNTGTSGAGGTGTGISGVASGRVFKGCPKPQVALRHKTTVVVNVVIDADGNVTSARAKGGAPADIRRACERAARAAKWSVKKDASETHGTITFTITPR